MTCPDCSHLWRHHSDLGCMVSRCDCHESPPPVGEETERIVTVFPPEPSQPERRFLIVIDAPEGGPVRLYGMGRTMDELKAAGRHDDAAAVLHEIIREVEHATSGLDPDRHN